jgi:hypothetical protein
MQTHHKEGKPKRRKASGRKQRRRETALVVWTWPYPSRNLDKLHWKLDPRDVLGWTYNGFQVMRLVEVDIHARFCEECEQVGHRQTQRCRSKVMRCHQAVCVPRPDLGCKYYMYLGCGVCGHSLEQCNLRQEQVNRAQQQQQQQQQYQQQYQQQQAWVPVDGGWRSQDQESWNVGADNCL